MMRTAGLILLFGGFLAAAFVSVRRLDLPPGESVDQWATVEWGYYAAALAVGVVGVVLLRASMREAATRSEKVAADVAILLKSVDATITRLDEALKERDATDVYQVHRWIDDELVEHLNAFALARESMIPQFGLHAYAEVMSRFATGERYINRAWSASADGYIDEVWASIQEARAAMADAREQLSALTRAQPA